MANLLRWTTSLVNSGRAPSPDQMLGLFGVLDGVEIKGVSAPYKSTKKQVAIDTLSLDWGAAGRLDPQQGAFRCKTGHADRSVRSDAAAADRRPASTSSRSTSISMRPGRNPPARLRSHRSFSISAALRKRQLRIALGNVPREALSADPATLMAQAAQVDGRRRSSFR